MDTCVIFVSSTVREDHIFHLSWKDQGKTRLTCDYQWFPLMISIIALYVGLSCELSKNNVIRSLICRNNNIFVMNSGQVFRNIKSSGSLNTYVAVLFIDLLCLLILNGINDLTALTHSERVLTSSFSRFVHFLA